MKIKNFLPLTQGGPASLGGPFGILSHSWPGSSLSSQSGDDPGPGGGGGPASKMLFYHKKVI